MGGRNTDYSTYLLPHGSADVFFPTNFAALRDLWLAAGRLERAALPAAAVDVLPTAAFMTMYAEVQKTKTAGAYNPLTDDFLNTSIFLADSSRLGPTSVGVK